MEIKDRVRIPLERTAICLILLLSMGMLAWSGDKSAEEKAVVSVVERFFALLAHHDAKEAEAILVPRGVSISLRYKDKETSVRATGFKDLVASLAQSKENYKETMADPKVMIHKGLAVLWADYKFYKDGNLTHCGVDAFNLIKSDGTWKIAAIVYTVEPQGCPH